MEQVLRLACYGVRCGLIALSSPCSSPSLMVNSNDCQADCLPAKTAIEALCP